MKCKHFGSCGSCRLYAMEYASQLAAKEQKVSQLLTPFYTNRVTVFDSPDKHYRARAEYRIWHEGAVCDYAMGNMAKDGAVTIEECPKVIEPIEKRMWRLLDRINASPEVLKRKLFAVEFLATTTDEVLITMLYHRKLDEAWVAEAQTIETSLNCKVMGRSRKQKVVLSEEFVTEVLPIDGREVTYVQYESGFTQPNPTVNIKMIAWAIAKAQQSGGGDLLEAYCGLGNFTLPLSRYYDKVLATEISKRSIHAALQNCEANGVTNITFVRMASEEMTQALQGVRSFERLKGIDLAAYHFSTVLVDPPRAGLDEGTMRLIATIEFIIYISCNPETLARDLEQLTQSHEVVDVALFDQFPHTEHIESGVFLKRRMAK